MSLLAGRRALVTGATSGIGRAVVLALAERGTRVALLGRDQARLADAARQAEARGASQVVSVRADLASPAELAEVPKRLRESMGEVEVLVHCAGVIAYGTFASGNLADLDAQFEANVRGPYLLTQSLLPG